MPLVLLAIGRSPSEVVATAKDVGDPFLRQISKVQGLIGASPVKRTPGEFSKPEEDAAEPERTERLLARPFALFHARAGDSFDTINMFWLMRSTGDSVFGTFYDFICYLTMLSLGIVYGLESWVQGLGDEASAAQAVVVLCLQLALAFSIVLTRPSIDKLESVQNTTQLTFEGLSTLLLALLFFFRTLDPDRDAQFAFLAFLGVLIAVLVPLILTLYDSAVVPLIEWRANGGDLKSLKTTLFKIAMSGPG